MHTTWPVLRLRGNWLVLDSAKAAATLFRILVFPGPRFPGYTTYTISTYQRAMITMASLEICPHPQAYVVLIFTAAKTESANRSISGEGGEGPEKREGITAHNLRNYNHPLIWGQIGHA